jgi:acetyl esterase/lipase
MLARVLAILAALHVALALMPALTWPLWMLHFAALETCLLAAVVGSVAAWLAEERWLRMLAVAATALALVPAAAAIPVYARERAAFSPWRWLGGNSVPEVVPREVVLVPGLVADMYAAPSSVPSPYVLVFHGGSWRAGDKGEVPHVSRALAAAGIAVFDVRYRLEPFPAPIEDARCALAAVQVRAAEWNLDPARGAFLGRSAGGQVALVAAYAGESLPSSRAQPAHPPKAVVAIYAPTDLAWAHDHPYTPDVVDGAAAIEQYLGGAPAEAPVRYRDAAPMRWLDRPVPPTLLIHGTAERCVRPRNTQVLDDALRRASAHVKTLWIPLADHGFDVRRGGIGEQVSRQVIARFLAEELAGR